VSPTPPAGTAAPATAPTSPPPRGGPPPGAATPNAATPAPGAAPAAPGGLPAAPGATPPPGRAQNTPPVASPAFQRAPQITAPLPPPPPALGTKALSAGAPAPGPRSLEQFRSERHETQEGGRTVITEPGRVIIRDPGGQEYIRHNEEDRFRFGARDIQTQTVGAETRTIVIRPDGSQIITVVGRDGGLL
jgi:OmpA-OmpF porin, OOP family